MKLKKLLALALAGAMLTASLTACTPLDAAELVYDSIFGGGSSSTGSSTGSTAEDAKNRAVAEGAADHFKSVYPITEVSYGVPELTSTIRPAFTPDWFQKDEEGNIIYLKSDFPIDAGLHLDDFLRGSLKAYEQSNYVSFIAFDSTGMSAREQTEKFSSGVPSVGVYDKGVSPGANTKLRVGVCHKTVAGREYCLVVVVRAR